MMLLTVICRSLQRSTLINLFIKYKESNIICNSHANVAILKLGVIVVGYWLILFLSYNIFIKKINLVRYF